MYSFDPNDDPKEYLNIKLKSEAFEEGVPSFYNEKPENTNDIFKL